MADFDTVVVLDNGTGSFKAGFVSDGSPRCVVPSLLAKGRGMMRGQTTTFVGEEATSKRKIMNVTNPMSHGIVESWEDAEIVWEYIFSNKLQVSATDCAMLVSEPAVNPSVNREKMVEIMMETFRTPALYLAKQSVLSLRAVGLKTGVVLMCGAGYTASVPIRDGLVIGEAVTRSSVAGNMLDGLLSKLINIEGGENVHNMDTVRDIKEKLCYVVDDFGSEMAKDDSENAKTYQAADGVDIVVKSALFQCPETLFQPCIMDEASEGISEIINSSIDRCTESHRPELLASIVLSGGSTLFPNFEGRLEKELKATSPLPKAIKLMAPSDRQNLVWRGGAMLADECVTNNSWIKQQDYQEHGRNLVHSKCP